MKRWVSGPAIEEIATTAPPPLRHVQPAQGAGRGGHRGSHRVLVGRVTAHPVSSFTKLLRRGPQPVLIAARDGDGGPIGEQGAGTRQSDATPASRHEGGSAR